MAPPPHPATSLSTLSLNFHHPISGADRAETRSVETKKNSVEKKPVEYLQS